MCGITGIIGNFVTDFEYFNNTLTHRGPDAGGIFESKSKTLKLGHRRLSILDLSNHANQPMHSSCGRYTIVFNGEVYNFKALQTTYQLTCQTSSDTEVILQLYIKLGTQMPSLLNGMFALAIYDHETENLFMARDQIGIKPLFYYWDGVNFAFSSELKSFKYLGKTLSINQEAVPYFLHLGYIPQPLTIYNHIYKFPTGNYLTINEHQRAVDFICYWNLEDQIGTSMVSDEKLAKQQLEDLLFKSIEKQMVSDVPIGTFLSGGIDSSVVTAIATKTASKKVKTFSIGFHEEKYNEAPYAEAVAKHLQTDHHTFMIGEKDVLALVPSLMEVYDEPFGDSSAFPTMLVSKLAKAQVTVTLAGDGGDELFMGYGMYNWAERLNNPILKALKTPLFHTSTLLNNRWKRAGLLLDYNQKQHIKSHIFSQEQYLFSENDLNKLLVNPMFNFGTLNSIQSKRKLSPTENQSFWDIEHYLKDDLLVKVDRASMQYSLETRVPLLDMDLIHFSLNLNPTLKIKQGTSKYLLKEVLYQHVPKSLFDRPKRGFSIPLKNWLLTDLAYLINDYLKISVIEKYNLVNSKEVVKLIARFKAGEAILYNKLWHLIILHWWLETNKMSSKICS
ncbi:MAG: hypothetical protein RL711_193 [Bacteroidota bacterium]|jgi:asparagine synthase (glutamine-hydrolysing)